MDRELPAFSIAAAAVLDEHALAVARARLILEARRSDDRRSRLRSIDAGASAPDQSHEHEQAEDKGRSHAPSSPDA